MSAPAYGIDLGTSNSSIMVSDPDGTLVRVNDPVSGRPTVPTSVCRGPNGRLLIGTEAENAKNLHPGEFRREFKREFGEPGTTPIGGVEYTTVDLAAKVLEYLREQAEKAVPGRPRRVVLTVPVTWQGARRSDMLDAAVRAGFTRADLVLETEPEAAVRTAFEAAPDTTGTVLVYDLGGGTFDGAVGRRAPDGSLDVRSKRGVDSVGGADFTHAVLGLLRTRFPEQLAELLDGDLDVDVLRRRLQLLDTCETIKIRLSSRRAYDDDLTEFTPMLTLSLPREEFVAAIDPLVRRTLSSCEEMLAEADLTWADVDHVVPVGGSSKIPLVRQLLTERWGRPVTVPGEPELAVVTGAVLLARTQLEQEDAARRAEKRAKAQAEKERLERKAAEAERRRREKREREEREKAAREAEENIMAELDEGLTTASSASSSSRSASSYSSSSSLEPATLAKGGCAGMFLGWLLSGVLALLIGESEVAGGVMLFFVVAGAITGAVVAHKG